MAMNKKVAFITCRAEGISGPPPETYEDFLANVNGVPDRLGFVPGVYSWRARNRPFAMNCRMAFATQDRDFAVFDPKVLEGGKEVSVARAYGAALRRSMLWGRRVSVVSSRFALAERRSQTLQWANYVRQARVDVPKLESILDCFVPSSQLRLLEAVQVHARGSSDQKRKTDTFLSLLDFNSLFSGVKYSAGRSRQRPSRGSQVSRSPSWISCILLGNRDGPSQREQIGDEWRAWVVTSPPHAKSRSFEHFGTGASASDAQFHDASLVVERPEYQLDDEAVSRFCRALEHMSAHIVQLQSLRQFVDRWFGQLLNPATWEDKKNAATNFMRDWQHFTYNVSPLWALGTDDPQIDPQIVDTLDRALHLRQAWEAENARLRDLFNLSTQVLSDGDPSIHLNDPAIM